MRLLASLLIWETSADVGKLPEKFGQIIRKRRKAAKLSQEALADKAGLHRTYVGMLERGERTPTIVVLKQLADALGTTMVSLISELEAPDVSDPQPGTMNGD